jgi:hypothetical protein
MVDICESILALAFRQDIVTRIVFYRVDSDGTVTELSDYVAPNPGGSTLTYVRITSSYDGYITAGLDSAYDPPVPVDVYQFPVSANGVVGSPVLTHAQQGDRDTIRHNGYLYSSEYTYDFFGPIASIVKKRDVVTGALVTSYSSPVSDYISVEGETPSSVVMRINAPPGHQYFYNLRDDGVLEDLNVLGDYHSSIWMANDQLFYSTDSLSIPGDGDLYGWKSTGGWELLFSGPYQYDIVPCSLGGFKSSNLIGAAPLRFFWDGVTYSFSNTIPALVGYGNRSIGPLVLDGTFESGASTITIHATDGVDVTVAPQIFSYPGWEYIGGSTSAGVISLVNTPGIPAKRRKPDTPRSNPPTLTIVPPSVTDTNDPSLNPNNSSGVSTVGGSMARMTSFFDGYSHG